MKVTIIPSDGYVSIDGRGFHGIDMTGIDPQIHAIQWNGIAGDMELVPDENGHGANITLANLGFIQPVLSLWQAAADAEDNPPPPSVSEAADIQMKILNSACRDYITGGIISDALGAPHTYPTDISTEHPDQQNLNGCVTESLLNGPEWTVPFWCADIDMKWDRRIHTSIQIQQVGVEVAAHVRTAQDLLKVAFDQIQSIAADPALTDNQKRTAIASINW